MILVIEGLAMCFILLLVCVIGIAKDGPVGLVCFYEKDVQDRVLELCLTTKEQIKKRTIIAAIAVTLPMTILIPYMVYVINGTAGFRQSLIQMVIIAMIANIFDRIFIDWYWVGKCMEYPGHRGFEAIYSEKHCNKEMVWHTCRSSFSLCFNCMGNDLFRTLRLQIPVCRSKTTK